MSTLHDSILPENQQEAIRQIAQYCTEEGYYLGGGTAIAAQLGHRRSIDLDWFTQNEKLDPNAAVADLRRRGVKFSVSNIGHGSLHVAIEGVGVSFIRYRYPQVGDLLAWPKFGCQIASLQDLASMKIAAVTQRGEKKDFFDLVAICSAGLTLAEAIGLYRRKFSIDDIGHVLMSLCYFDDAEINPTPDLVAAPTWEEVKETMKAWVSELSR